ncbi:MAG: hypothetical protein JRG95_07800 [Deltaproteobacteria bacterium]|nr:hypothetical protein [Deltaproteobacteria bacterium]
MPSETPHRTTGLSARAIATRWALSGAALVGAAAVYRVMGSFGNDAFGAFFLALGSLLLVGVALGLFREGFHEALDHRALRAMTPDLPQPGAWVAIAGRAVARHRTTKATLSDRPALAFSYKVFERAEGAREVGRRSTYLGLRYEGYHQVPIGIETAVGVVRVCGLLDLVNLEKSGVGRGNSRLAELAESRSRFSPRYAARAYIAAQIQDRFEIDWRYGEGEGIDMPEGKEWVLPPDEEVCVFGRWDGHRLVPSALRPRGLPVYAGKPETLRGRLGGGSRIFFALGVITLSLAAGLLYWNS